MAKLTAAAVAKLKADPARRREIPDGLLPGLYLLVQPSGRKSWAVRYRSAGAPRKLTLGGYPALELAHAREAAREALRTVQKGADPAQAKQAARRTASERGGAERDGFETVARQFLDRYAKPKNRTWRETARVLGLIPDPANPDEAENPRAFVLKQGGLARRWSGRRVQDITRRDIVDALDDIVDRGAPIAANRALAALRKLFAWAVDRTIVATSPAAGVKPPAAEVSRDRVLTDAELRAVWRAADAIGWPFGRVVQVLVLTGQRRDEVREMAERELDLTAKTWTIPRERAKNDRAHDVPLGETAVALLAGLPIVKNTPGYRFSTNGRTAVSGFAKAKERLDGLALGELRRAAVERGDDAETVEFPPWRLHDLRRTLATGMARLGINLPVIEKVLNHTSGSFGGVAGVYQRHSFTDEKRRALEAWGQFVTALVAGTPSNVVRLTPPSAPGADLPQAAR